MDKSLSQNMANVHGVVPKISWDIMNIWWNWINVYDSTMEDIFKSGFWGHSEPKIWQKYKNVWL